MTDTEFHIIDELYFVTPYDSLKSETGYDDELLSETLIALVDKGWVRVYKSMDEESEMDQIDLRSNFKSYFYLASKKGLFEHNSR